MATAAAPVLELVGVSKSFGGVEALRDVDFSLRAGEIHGLVGENGAGKSTTMKIIAGVHTDYAGVYRIDGRPVAFRSARDSLAAGIAMVHQELSIAPDLTVAENVFLGKQPMNALRLRRLAPDGARGEGAARGLGIDVDPQRRIGDLPIGLQQLIEIARVLFSGARIIILDEPTSALSPPEIERLFAVLRHMRDGGRSIIFISHFLDDILRISDTVTVFRNGRKVLTAPVPTTTRRWLIETMIGAGHEGLEESYTGAIRSPAPSDAPGRAGSGRHLLGRAYRDVSLRGPAPARCSASTASWAAASFHSRAPCSAACKPDSGSLRIAGRAIRMRSTATARSAGVAFVPESRRAMLFNLEPVYKNMSIAILDRISRLWLKPAAERRIAARACRALAASGRRGSRSALGSLSGGNQQKVALAKWLTFPPKVLVLSEPTRGMDVGAKDDVVRIIRGLRDAGIA